MCCRTPNHRQNRVITFSLVAVCCIWLGQLIVYSSNFSFFSFIIHHSHGNLIFNNQSESRALFKRSRLPCSFSWDISSSRLASFRLRKRQTFQNQVSWFNLEFSVFMIQFCAFAEFKSTFLLLRKDHVISMQNLFEFYANAGLNSCSLIS